MLLFSKLGMAYDALHCVADPKNKVTSSFTIVDTSGSLFKPQLNGEGIVISYKFKGFNAGYQKVKFRVGSYPSKKYQYEIFSKGFTFKGNPGNIAEPKYLLGVIANVNYGGTEFSIKCEYTSVSQEDLSLL